ncbi:hypothetical protein HanLR1_Chr00c1613g0811291 [Helianthus annuus]|nr:hypothetical protein HanLR1_Chr00c1613g0811291 [Helianthus annuus]
MGHNINACINDAVQRDSFMLHGSSYAIKTTQDERNFDRSGQFRDVGRQHRKPTICLGYTSLGKN